MDVNEEYIVLDEFTPPEGHKLATSGAPFRFTGNDNGVAVTFKS